jgi:hypothetical protein
MSGKPSKLAEVPKPPMKTVSKPARSTSIAVKTSWAPKLRMMPGCSKSFLSQAFFSWGVTLTPTIFAHPLSQRLFPMGQSSVCHSATKSLHR